MRSSSIPRSLILVASAALSFGACATQMDPGGTGAMAPAATGMMAGSPAATASAGTTGGAAGKPAGTATATAGSTAAATGTAGKPAGAATAGGPATATGTAGTPAASGAAGAATAAAGMSGGAAGGAAAGMSGGAAGGAAAGGAVTFTMVHETVLTGTGCSVSVCHGSAQAPSKLGLADKADAYMGLVGVKAMGMPNAGSMGTGCNGMDFVRVKPGDPDNSLLVQKIENKQTCGMSMPPGSTPKPEHVKLIRDWIMAGAKND